MREIADIHEPFIRWLKEREIPYVYHRGDRKSGIHKGHPDFTILWCNRVRMIECKTSTGKLSKDQVDRIAFLQKSGNSVTIARSVEECVEACKDILLEQKAATEASRAFTEPFTEQFKELKEAVAAVGAPCDHVFDADGSPCVKCGRTVAEMITQKQMQSPPINGKQPHCFIGDLRGVPVVFYGTGVPGSSVEMLRQATAADLINLPRN